MYIIELNKTPNQRLGVTILGVNYTLETRLLDDGILLMNIYADNVLLISGLRCIPNAKVIPYTHLTNGGNFFWLCEDDHYPDWQKFNEQHSLLFLTDAELAANEL